MYLKSSKSFFSVLWILICLISSKHFFGQIEEDINIGDEPVYRNLSKALRNADKVYKLNLANMELKEFPDEIFKLKQLRILILDSNKILTIPNRINELENLLYLSIGNNSINEIPLTLGNLTKLRFLYLNNNNISFLPPSFFKLNLLEDLFINENKITELPKEIQVLQKLERLIVSNNYLESIPDEIGHLYGLKKLSFAENKIKILPEHFYELTNLTFLYLHNNYIEKIDSKIKKINQIEELTLDNNKLTTIPAEFGELYNLKTVYLNHNGLIALPIEIGNLFKLQNLFIGDNPIKEIPAGFNNLTKLQVLNISNIVIHPFPQVLYDIQNNGTKIKGLTTKELYLAKILLSQARNKNLIDNSVEAIPLYEKLIKTDTNNIVAMTEYASTLLNLGEFNKAANISKLALTKNMSQKNIDELRIIYSSSINKTTKAELIINSYTEKIKADSTNAIPIFELGKFYFDQQKYVEAKSTLFKAIKTDPTFADPHFYIAVISLSLKDDSLFILAILRYFSLHPEGSKTKTTFPFLLSKMKMKSGVSEKNGSTSYHDSYIIKDDNNEVIYKSENPMADLLSVMLVELTRDNSYKKSKRKENSELQEILDEAFYSKKNNFEIFQLELIRICKAITNVVAIEQDKQIYNYYLSYYKSLIENGHLEAFAYTIIIIRDIETENITWLNNNADKLEKFNQWNKAYKWSSK